MRQVMDDFGGLAVGAILVIVGVLCFVVQRRAWRQQSDDPSSDRSELQYLGRRDRRRSQISGMLVVIGTMIAVGDTAVDWPQRPAGFVGFWSVVLLLAIWVMVLGFSDMLSTQTHVRTTQRQRAQIEAELRRELERLKRLKQQDANGRNGPSG